MKEYVWLKSNGRRYLIRNPNDEPYILCERRRLYLSEIAGQYGGMMQVGQKRKREVQSPVDLYKKKQKEFMTSCGWNKAFLDKNLKKVQKGAWEVWYDEGYRDEEVIMGIVSYWIPKYIDDAAHDFKKSLKAIGFNRSSVHKYMRILPIDGPYSYRQLLDIAVECAIGKYDPIAPPGKNYLYDKPANAPYRLKKYESVLHINARHVSEQEIGNHMSSNNTEEMFYYHCCSYASAKNIFQEGVDHGFGRRCLDFGSMRSFYMTPTLETALGYASKNKRTWEKECAIVVFRFVMPKQCRVMKVNSEWSRLVGMSRRCQKNNLNKCDFVYGPMAANVKDILDREAPQEPLPHKPVKWQVATKGREADDFLNNSMVGVIWLAKRS